MQQAVESVHGITCVDEGTDAGAALAVLAEVGTQMTGDGTDFVFVAAAEIVAVLYQGQTAS